MDGAEYTNDQLPRVPAARMRFTVRRLMLIVAALSLLLGSLVWLLKPDVEIRLATPPQRANMDFDVFDAMLKDLIDNKDFAPATHASNIKKTEIFLDVLTTGGGGDYSSLKRFVETRKSRPVSLDLFEDFADRNPRKVRFSLVNYHPSSDGVLLRDLSKNELALGMDFSFVFPKTRGWLRVALPAYSIDGKQAIIFFEFGPTEHGAKGYYLLRKVDGRWEVIDRQFGYYT